jgi:hypothetical protein
LGGVSLGLARLAAADDDSASFGLETAAGTTPWSCEFRRFVGDNVEVVAGRARGAGCLGFCCSVTVDGSIGCGRGGGGGSTDAVSGSGGIVASIGEY